jgi:hypothetical protein
MERKRPFPTYHARFLYELEQMDPRAIRQTHAIIDAVGVRVSDVGVNTLVKGSRTMERPL